MSVLISSVNTEEVASVKVAAGPRIDGERRRMGREGRSRE